MATKKQHNNSKRFPNLICPGAQKAGTTTMYKILQQHPDISIGTMKEIKYFNNFYHRGDRWYKKVSDLGSDTKYIMDFTPGYMLEEEWVQRIKDSLGDEAVFLIILRNPVDRMFSTYSMYRSNGIDTEQDIAKAFEKDYKGYLAGKNARTNYYKHGLYANQVKYFFDRFPKEKVKIILFEDFINDTKKEVIDILKFLDLPIIQDMEFDIWANKTIEGGANKTIQISRLLIGIIPKCIRNRVPIKIEKFLKTTIRKKVSSNKQAAGYVKDPALCKEYMKKYIDDIKELEKLIGRDLSIWIDKYS